ncbi:Hypothetical protein NGAL_HAMBI1145_59700 [Neorhizobium galegae bv. officinalis]|uniref:EF-hand domain-containing protein n=1 Tax=Neorhizobium galegae bv. officinalis TaxID=323656 RepID=A0A0T7G2Q6_NEOGA|nr:hypothetical protein [Neorhizobium galegae]CDZ41594.1 Hypothetical protein NGAL_HAMBI1145_59700 [Neorhizobium galegae bv. officinalis]
MAFQDWVLQAATEYGVHRVLGWLPGAAKRGGTAAAAWALSDSGLKWLSSTAVVVLSVGAGLSFYLPGGNVEQPREINPSPLVMNPKPHEDGPRFGPPVALPLPSPAIAPPHTASAGEKTTPPKRAAARDEKPKASSTRKGKMEASNRETRPVKRSEVAQASSLARREPTLLERFTAGGNGAGGISSDGGDCPIVFDYNRTGQIETTSETTSKDKRTPVEPARLKVMFDLKGNGTPLPYEWILPGDALPVDNRDGRAPTDMNGKRLFGDEDGKYQSGYEKFAAWDHDGNGVLEGAELSGLDLWFDNGDAVVQDGELIPATQAGVKVIPIHYNVETNEQGQRFMRSSLLLEDGTRLMSEDVWFKHGSAADTVGL